MPEPARPWLTVIIPVWRDVEGASQRCAEIRSFQPDLTRIEILVAVPQGQEGVFDPALGVIQVSCPRRGRGHQIAEAVRVAQGESLLIQHADNRLTAAHLQALRRALADPATVAGAYHRDFAANWPLLRNFESLSRWWSVKFAPLYGDQSMFIRRSFLDALGGFPDIPLMEDVELGWRVRGRCQPVLLDPPMCASMRRFERRGWLRNRLGNLLILTRYALGDSPFALYKKYYGCR